MIAAIRLWLAAYWALVNAPPRPEETPGEAVDTWGW